MTGETLRLRLAAPVTLLRQINTATGNWLSVGIGVMAENFSYQDLVEIGVFAGGAHVAANP